MRLAHLFWLFLLLITVNGQNLTQCHILAGDLELIDYHEICVVSEKKLGHEDEKFTVDFSKTSQEVLDKFLSQFIEIRGGIVMDGNEMVTSLNLPQVNASKLTGWVHIGPRINETFINIRNNPQLKSITGGPFVTVHKNPILIFIYNNSQLGDESIDGLKSNLSNISTIEPEIQDKQGVCQFSNRMDPSIYVPPTEESLQSCKAVKGDFILTGGAPTGTIELLGGGCLILKNVNLTNYKINFTDANKGKAELICNNAQFSTLFNNSGLCEEEMSNLIKYFPDNVTDHLPIQFHPSCAVDCTTKVELLSRFRPCRTANGLINDWFTRQNLKYKIAILESSSDYLNITKLDHVQNVTLPKLTIVNEFNILNNPVLTTLNLPKLGTAERLVIHGNDALTSLEMPQLINVETLIITENPRLIFDNLYSDLLNVEATNFEIDCITLRPDQEPDYFEDVERLEFCTKIIGPLILDGLTEDVDISELGHIQLVDGCITVRNTNLTNIRFLEKIQTTCEDSHLLEENPNLCPIKWLNTIPVRIEGDFKKRCGAICHKKVSLGCVKAHGEISITGETPKPDYEDLEIIYGSLTIYGTDLRSLNLPNLDEITGSKGPLLRIVNNDELSMIQMPALMKIKLLPKGTGPLIEIRGNIKLEAALNSLNFLPEELRDACLEGREEICIYDGKEEHPEWTFTKAAIILTCLIGYLLVFCGCLVVCCRQERREIQQMQARSDAIAERLVIPERRRSTAPGSSVGPSVIQSEIDQIPMKSVISQVKKSQAALKIEKKLT